MNNKLHPDNAEFPIPKGIHLRPKTNKTLKNFSLKLLNPYRVKYPFIYRVKSYVIAVRNRKLRLPPTT